MVCCVMKITFILNTDLLDFEKLLLGKRRTLSEAKVILHNAKYNRKQVVLPTSPYYKYDPSN